MGGFQESVADPVPVLCLLTVRLSVLDFPSTSVADTMIVFDPSCSEIFPDCQSAVLVATQFAVLLAIPEPPRSFLQEIESIAASLAAVPARLIVASVVSIRDALGFSMETVSPDSEVSAFSSPESSKQADADSAKIVIVKYCQVDRFVIAFPAMSLGRQANRDDGDD